MYSTRYSVSPQLIKTRILTIIIPETGFWLSSSCLAFIIRPVVSSLHTLYSGLKLPVRDITKRQGVFFAKRGSSVCQVVVVYENSQQTRLAHQCFTSKLCILVSYYRLCYEEVTHRNDFLSLLLILLLVLPVFACWHQNAEQPERV